MSGADIEAPPSQRATTRNRTTPIPSLKTLSPSTSMATGRGTPRARKVASTLTGSVGASIAATSRATGHE